MSHEVYICYDEKDQITADAICHVLEDNKIKCWLKTRDLGVKHIVDEIMEAINESQAMVLIFSDHSKHSNFVNTEVDIAFTKNIPILVFKIDESKLDGGLEFFLNNKHWLDAYPNPEVKFESLIRDTSKLLGKPISEPIVSQSDEKPKRPSILNRRKSKKPEETKPKETKPKETKPKEKPEETKPKDTKPKESKPKKESKPIKQKSGSSSSKIPILIGVVVVLAIAIVGGYFLLNQDKMEYQTLVISDSAYMKVPKANNTTTYVDDDGIFHYTDNDHGINVTSCNLNLSKNSSSAMNKLKKEIESDSKKIEEGDFVIYEKNGTYSVYTKNNQTKDIILIQSKNKDYVINCLNSIVYHNPTDSLKLDDSEGIVNATQQTQTAISQASSSSSSASSSSYSPSSDGSSSSGGASVSDWESSSSSSRSSGGASVSDWESSSSSSRSSGHASVSDWEGK